MFNLIFVLYKIVRCYTFINFKLMKFVDLASDLIHLNGGQKKTMLYVDYPRKIFNLDRNIMIILICLICSIWKNDCLCYDDVN